MDDVMVVRNHKIEADRDLLIQMDPEVAKIFQKSTAVSGKWPGYVSQTSVHLIF